MNNTASIAQEFYKLHEEWARADKLKSWQLAIWVAQYQDVDIIDKFIETERLAIGAFEDIFFRFDTEYKGDMPLFEKQLWHEYENWWIKPANPKQDIVQALKNDGLLANNFEPVIDCNSGFQNLLKEMLRLKTHLKGFDKLHFCIYFSPTRPEANILGEWLSLKIALGIPQGIRLITIDFAAARKIRVPSKYLHTKVIEILPQLNMLQAINNEMDKGGGTSDTVSIDSRFRKQIRVVMQSTLKKNVALTAKEATIMIGLSKQMGNKSSEIAGLLVAAQAHYTIKNNEQSELYIDEAILKAETEMNGGNPAGYHSWKACIMLKGALLAAKRKWEPSIVLYENLAECATKNNDIFYIMEGYRISGHLHYLRGRLKPAFEKSLLAMVAGSELDKTMIRQSTFLHAAYLAVFIGRKIKRDEEMKILEEQLEDWIGEDWKEMIDSSELENSTTKPKNVLMPF
jgi:hypothetical protein